MLSLFNSLRLSYAELGNIKKNVYPYYWVPFSFGIYCKEEKDSLSYYLCYTLSIKSFICVILLHIPINHRRIWDGWIVLSGIMTIAFSLYALLLILNTMCFLLLSLISFWREFLLCKKICAKTPRIVLFVSIVSDFYSYFVAINR